MPIFFVAAVTLAVTAFVLVTSKGLVLAIGLALFVMMLLYSFTSSAGALFCLMIAAYFEGLYKGMSASMFTLLIKDFFLAIALLRLLFISQRQRSYRWLQQPFITAAVVFVIYCSALMFAPSTRSVIMALAGFRAWILWMPLFFPVYAYFTNKQTIIRFLTIMLLMQLPANIYGIVQGNIGYEHTRVIPGFYEITKWYHIDAELNGTSGHSEDAGDSFESGFKPIMAVRACSIDVSPGIFGSMCVITIMLALGLLAYTTSGSMRLWCLLSALAGAGGLLASGSRAPMVGLIVGICVMIAVSRRRAAAIAGLLIIILAAGFVLKDITGSGAVRLRRKLTISGAIERSLEPMKVGWESGMEHPFGNGIATGIGVGRIFYGAGLKAAEGSSFIENEFGRALSELGVVGASLWLTLIVGALWYALRGMRGLGVTREAELCAGLVGMMATVFIQLGVGSALYAQPGMFYWIAVAAILRLAQFKDQAEPGAIRPQAPLQRRKFGRIYLNPGEVFQPYSPTAPPDEPQQRPPDVQRPA